MKEYIEREAAISLARTTPADWENETSVPVRALKNIPAADVVPVVRCKDCRWHEDEEPGMVWCPRVIGSWVSNNWYCADGERKGGVSDDDA